MIYFLLGLLTGSLFAFMNVILYNKKVQDKINEIVRRKNQVEFINPIDPIDELKRNNEI